MLEEIKNRLITATATGTGGVLTEEWLMTGIIGLALVIECLYKIWKMRYDT
jgi:hypothetical protein